MNTHWQQLKLLKQTYMVYKNAKVMLLVNTYIYDNLING